MEWVLKVYRVRVYANRRRQLLQQLRVPQPRRILSSAATDRSVFRVRKDTVDVYVCVGRKGCALGAS
jgi:hypothetical protein